MHLAARAGTGPLAVRRLLALQPPTAVRVRPEGIEEKVPLEGLRPRDRVRVRPGLRAPVAGVVVGGSAVDLQLVTGEAISRDYGRGVRWSEIPSTAPARWWCR